LDRGPGRLNLQSLSPDKYIHLIKFAPEPFAAGDTSVGFTPGKTIFHLNLRLK
jgi:hypothetical protein